MDEFFQLNSIGRIDFMKIDTEGAEFSVLKGAKKLLEAHNIDTIQFEYGGCCIDAGTTLRALYDFLKERGYEIYLIYPDGLLHISEWIDELENFKYSNYIASCII